MKKNDVKIVTLQNQFFDNLVVKYLFPKKYHLREMIKMVKR